MRLIFLLVVGYLIYRYARRISASSGRSHPRSPQQSELRYREEYDYDEVRDAEYREIHSEPRRRDER